MDAEPSRTAIFAAVIRAQHRLEDAPPWVLDDPFALPLVGPSWRELAQFLSSVLSEDLQRQARAAMTMRSRYAEDRLSQGAFTQYVLLGAGLDSFAWRRPDLLRSLRVFEVDHPASQAWKRQRATELGLPMSDHHLFAPVDFEVDSLRDGLEAAGFDWAQPTMFSWLGVTMYLTTDAIAATLRTVATGAPGSEVAFSYRADESVLDDTGRKIIEIIGAIAIQLGEPFTEERPRAEIERLVQDCGLGVEDHPTREDTIQRYFANRSDGMVSWSVESLLAARVP